MVGESTISVLDRGLLYGDGCFEVLRTWAGVPVELAAHLDRLLGTAAALQLRTLERSAIERAVAVTVADAAGGNGGGGGGDGELRIRIVLTRGPGGLGERLGAMEGGRTIVIVEPLGEQPEEISAATVAWSLPERAGAGHKTLAYLDHVIARELAREAGADEAIRLDVQGRIAEGATCNVFVVDGRGVRTPPLEGVLPGIVRARVLELCPSLGIAAAVAPITRDEMARASELFVTSSLRGVVPITCIDRVPRDIGAITRRIAQAYRAQMHARAARGGT